jgi:hypothetical protein
MRMVFRALVLAITLACAPVAYAQDKPTPEPASEQAVAAAQSFFNAFLFESGMIGAMLDAVMSEDLPGLRTSMMNSTLYRDADARQRAALEALADDIPVFFRAEFNAEMTTVVNAVSPRFALLLSEAELAEAAAYLRRPENAQSLRNAASQIAQNGKNGDLPDFASLFPDFEQTAAGRAIVREEDALSLIFEEEMQAATGRLLPRLQRTMYQRICAALAEDCPPLMRESFGVPEPT